jgi:hypothetical protein
MSEHDQEKPELFADNGSSTEGSSEAGDDIEPSGMDDQDDEGDADDVVGQGVGTGDAPPSGESASSARSAGRPAKGRRGRVVRTIPSVPFEEALELPNHIQQLAGGHPIRRLRLFQLLERSPDSGPSRMLLSNSARYGLTTGTHGSEWIELTPDGRTATAEDVPERERIRARFKLAIEQIAPFQKLHQHYVNSRLPAKPIIADFLRDQKLVNEDEVSQCVDIFLLNAKFVGVLQVISGAERLVPLDHVLDYAPAGIVSPAQAAAPQAEAASHSGNGSGSATVSAPRPGGRFDAASRVIAATHLDSGRGDEDGAQYDRICFYITPIGEEGSETRKHSDLFLGSIVEPALEDFDLTVVRADRINAAGFITRQILEHIVRSKLVIADLSYHNPNVFYELALRHAIGKPTVQIIRAGDRLPFDVEPMRTIKIDTSSIYTLVPQLDTYRAAIAAQVRQALESPDSVDNPVTAFLPSLNRQATEQQ